MAGGGGDVGNLVPENREVRGVPREAKKFQRRLGVSQTKNRRETDKKRATPQRGGKKGTLQEIKGGEEGGTARPRKTYYMERGKTIIPPKDWGGEKEGTGTSFGVRGGISYRGVKESSLISKLKSSGL